MSSLQAAGTRGAGSIASALMLVALLVVMLTAAAPATAVAVKVVGGDTQLTIPKAQVLALTANDVAVLPVPPVSFRFQWEPGLSWWYDLPIASGSTFDYATKKGAFLHGGKLRFVNVLTEQELLFGGLRVVFTNTRTIALSSAVGTAPATRAVVFTATNTPGYTKQGKTITIDGIQFKLTDAGALALKLALGADLPTTTLFADADLRFKIR
jgi:hypothetical protein